jgi:hypothetical protein
VLAILTLLQGSALLRHRDDRGIRRSSIAAEPPVAATLPVSLPPARPRAWTSRRAGRDGSPARAAAPDGDARRSDAGAAERRSAPRGLTEQPVDASIVLQA